MSISSCKCPGPLICCSKPSVLHSSPKPKSVDAHKVISSPPPSPLSLEKDSCDEKARAGHESVDNEKVHAEHESVDNEKAHAEHESIDNEEFEVLPRSSIKKPGISYSEKACKGNVKWMDFLGKELVEIKEFEPEDEDSDDEVDGNASCTCSIQ